MKRALHFGHNAKHGYHIMQRPDGKVSFDVQDDIPAFPWTSGLIDSLLLKNRGVHDAPDGRVFWALSGEPLWHAFFWWDRSGDHRGGSNSGFYVCGFDHGEAAKAFAYACGQFPQIVKRQRFPLQLQDPVR